MGSVLALLHFIDFVELMGSVLELMGCNRSDPPRFFTPSPRPVLELMGSGTHGVSSRIVASAHGTHGVSSRIVASAHELMGSVLVELTSAHGVSCEWPE